MAVWCTSRARRQHVEVHSRMAGSPVITASGFSHPTHAAFSCKLEYEGMAGSSQRWLLEWDMVDIGGYSV